jgi:hypothetical protein
MSLLFMEQMEISGSSLVKFIYVEVSGQRSLVILANLSNSIPMIKDS